MDAERVHALRDALRHTEWWARACTVGGALRATSGPGHLLLVGTPRVEPWHLAAHLDDEARLSDLPQLAPALVRWQPPAAAPPHLSMGLSRLERVSRGETVFVVSPDAAPDPLLERVDDARRTGATIVALDAQDGPLADLAHERMTVSPAGLSLPESLQQVLAPASGTQRDLDPFGARRLGVEGLGAEALAAQGLSAQGLSAQGVGAQGVGAQGVGGQGLGAQGPGAHGYGVGARRAGRVDEQVDVPPEVAAGLALPASFELAQHFVSAAAGSPAELGSRGWRSRLGSLLDAICGPRPSSLGG
jgi:hypothetical protein